MTAHEALDGLGRSGIREVMDLAATLSDVVHLEIGEPDFPTPPHVVEAAQRALAEKLRRANGIEATAESVVVTAGGTAAVFGALTAVTRPGDAVLLPDPGWPAFELIAQLAGAVVRRYRLRPESGFEPDLDELDSLAGDARVIVLNSPSNPTGAVSSRETVEGVLELAARHGLVVLSDEVYEQIVFEGEHVSPGGLDADGRMITVHSFSKGYAMTGWRVGYLTARAEIVDAVVRV